MSEVSTGGGLMPCPHGIHSALNCFDCHVAAWNQRATPEPASDLVELVARAILHAMPTIKGGWGAAYKLAAASLAAMTDRAATKGEW